MNIYDCANKFYLSNMPLKIRMVYESHLVVDGEPDRQKTYDAVTPHNGKKICLDIECWEFKITNYDEAHNQLMMEKYLQVMEWARQAAPDSDIGFFKSRFEYSELFHESSWANYDRLMTQLSPLYECQDTLYPSSYITYDKPDLWYMYMGTVLSELAVHGKPIVPFVWHKNTKPEETEVGMAMWRKQLSFFESLALNANPNNHPIVDGIAVWVKSDEEHPGGNDEWWVELKRFL